jgi:hypothetical protein
MKNHISRKLVIPLAATLLCLSACGHKVLDYRNAQFVNGKIYSGGANSPFSGAVTNVPNGQILIS